MENRASVKASDYMDKFKEHIKDIILDLELPTETKNAVMQDIYNYGTLTFTVEDFSKRKRIKNIVPRCERCCAKRANDYQCTRKRRDGSMFCGTHIKGTPHGTIENVSKENVPLKQIELIAHEIKGIIYYLDNNGNVYKTEDVLHNKVNPCIIARYIKDDNGVYSIPEFNI